MNCVEGKEGRKEEEEDKSPVTMSQQGWRDASGGCFHRMPSCCSCRRTHRVLQAAPLVMTIMMTMSRFFFCFCGGLIMCVCAVPPPSLLSPVPSLPANFPPGKGGIGVTEKELSSSFLSPVLRAPPKRP